jgi:hypothetical protein
MNAIMKKGILFLLLAGLFAANAHAQSLKDLLYSGKLKKDSNTVIRKGDDLSSKIDTSTKKPVEQETVKTTTANVELGRKAGAQADSAGLIVDTEDSSATTANNINSNSTPAKNNNAVFKEYMDSLSSTLKTDVLPSKKIKSDTYYLYVDYEIGTDGQVNVTNVVSSPENSFLQDQVKQRLVLDAPKLDPVLDSSNKPRKVKRKYNFNITKE